ncbi:hypothetical protein BT93_K1627 [Corymbia citriodora subsp. variegata]|nr:hypothetical protein BT93_K1627 [Corymbia citriodora subsp. variegata]
MAAIFHRPRDVSSKAVYSHSTSCKARSPKKNSYINLKNEGRDEGSHKRKLRHLSKVKPEQGCSHASLVGHCRFLSGSDSLEHRWPHSHVVILPRKSFQGGC